MRGFRLTRLLVRAAVRENNRLRRQQRRKRVQPKPRKTSRPKSKMVLKNAYPPYVPPQQYYQPPPKKTPYGNQSPPLQPGQFQPQCSFHSFLLHLTRQYPSFQKWYEVQSLQTKLKVWLTCLIIGLVSIVVMATAIISNAQTQSFSPAPTQGTSVTHNSAQTTIPTLTATFKPTPTSRSTPTPKPTPTPTVMPTQIVSTPTPTHTRVNGNPWGYDFNAGNYIDYPPAGFCNYFNCIASFYGSDDPGDGYIIECQDQTYSQSGGERGACSYHGGELRPLYSH